MRGGENRHPRHYAKDETRRQIRTSKYRYITFTGTKREKKDLMKQLRYPIIKEYPKGDTTTYDIANPRPIYEARECENKASDGCFRVQMTLL